MARYCVFDETHNWFDYLMDAKNYYDYRAANGEKAMLIRYAAGEVVEVLESTF